MSTKLLLDVLRRVEVLERRLNSVVVEGVVAEVQAKPYRVKVDYGTAAEPRLTAWLAVAADRSAAASVWWPLEVGEAVSVVSPNGELKRGRVTRSRFTEDKPPLSDDLNLFKTAFGDGATIEYKRDTHALVVTLPAEGTTAFTSPDGFTFNGDSLFNGNIKATGDIEDHTRSMQADRDIYNDHNHTGDSGGATAEPNQQQ